MSNNTTSSTSGTSTGSIDYLALLGNLSPLPFDSNTVVNALLAVDQLPINSLNSQIKNIQTNETIYKAVGTDVAAFQSIAFNMSLQSNVQAKTASSITSTVATATAAPTVLSGNYTVKINSLATATTAVSQGSIGLPLIASAALNTLDLNTPPTNGTVSIVVDGALKTFTIDITKALTDSPAASPAKGGLSQLESAINSSLTDGSSATVSVVNNKVQIQLNGASMPHTISFGSSGDTSNFLSVMNLSTVSGTTAGPGIPPASLTMTSSSAVGVAQVSKIMTSSSLATTLTGTLSAGGHPTGSFTVNGKAIAWDSGTDSINDVLNRINNSTAGVVAAYNSTNDQVTLTNKVTGQGAITLADTGGTFLTAMNLAPGTVNSETLGGNASATVNGTTVVSTSNNITNAVPGLTITANGLGTTTLTVGTDTAAITKNVQGMVDAANKVLADIYLTQQKDPTSGTYSNLLGDPTLIGIQNKILNTITGTVTHSGAYQSLQDIGVTMPSYGAGGGAGPQLKLDAGKLASALAAAPDEVGALFTGTTVTNGFQGVGTALNTYLTTESNPVNSPFATFKASNDAEIKTIQTQVSNLTRLLAQKKTSLTQEFTAMAQALSALSAQSSALTSLSGLSSSNAATTSTSSTTGH